MANCPICLVSEGRDKRCSKCKMYLGGNPEKDREFFNSQLKNYNEARAKGGVNTRACGELAVCWGSGYGTGKSSKDSEIYTKEIAKTYHKKIDSVDRIIQKKINERLSSFGEITF